MSAMPEWLTWTILAISFVLLYLGVMQVRKAEDILERSEAALDVARAVQAAYSEPAMAVGSAASRPKPSPPGRRGVL